MKLPKNVIPQKEAKHLEETSKPVVVGFDFETDVKTGRPMFLTIYYPDNVVRSISKDNIGDYQSMLNLFFRAVKYCRWNGGILAYWREIDMICLLRLFTGDDRDRLEAICMRFGKLDFGEYCTREFRGDVRTYNVSIKKCIRGSLDISFQTDDFRPKTIKAYDISKVYQTSLEKACKSVGVKYDKGKEELHLVDWKRFRDDREYRDRVIDSNQTDARAHKELADKMFDNFYDSFKIYPEFLYSPASITKTFLKSRFSNEQLKDMKLSAFLERVGDENVALDFYHLTAVAYNGGLIDAPRIGYCKEVKNIDIASAYVSPLLYLPDLKNAELKGPFESPMEEPKEGEIHIGYGTVNVNEGYHSFSVQYNDSLIYPHGEFRTAYTWEQRKQAEVECKATFKDERWYKLVFKDYSPVAYTMKELLRERDRAIAEGDKIRSNLIKTITLSAYGITYECIPTYELKDGEVNSTGYYKEGKFTNFLYAVLITSPVRVKMASMANELERQGCRVILFMTDGIYYKEGNRPPDIEAYITREDSKEKAVGYFEPPTTIRDFMCLGTGIYGGYEYDENKQSWEYIAKTKGLNPIRNEEDDISASEARIFKHNFEAVDFTTWHDVIKDIDVRKDNPRIRIKQLITPGLCSIQPNKYSMDNLGKVTNREDNMTKQVNLRQVEGKRELLEFNNNLKRRLLETRPYCLLGKVEGIQGIKDETLEDEKDWYETTREEHNKQRNRNKEANMRNRKQEFIRYASEKTGLEVPTGRELTGSRKPVENVSWNRLEQYFGISRKGYQPYHRYQDNDY